MKTKEIQMDDLVHFCEAYNSIGYGEAEIIELQNKFIIKLYNAGFSENESMGDQFKDKYQYHIIYDKHPIIIAEFSKLPIRCCVVNYDNLKDWCDCYSKKKRFTFLIDIE